MKYTVVSFINKVISAFLAFVMGIFSSPVNPVTKDRPEPNTVSVYDTESADYQLNIDADDEIKDISDLLFGIFFEDINFAADGGLYAEKVANRSFEFTQLAEGDELYGYSSVNGAGLNVQKDSNDGLNKNNKNYLVVTNEKDELAGVANRGYLDGISVEENAVYNFSVYAKSLNGYAGKIIARIVCGDEILAENSIPSINSEWSKYTLELESDKTAYENVYLQVLIEEGTVALDMISLFPEDTFKGRENGLRKDLGEMLEDLQPKFLRFPGGCVIEGYDKETAYSWKDSIGCDEDGEPVLFNGVYGDVAARRQGINIWTDMNTTSDPWPSFMSYGLGFYEYFLLCEDIGAVGVPVLNCGLFCQMRGRGPVDMNSPDFENYIDDMLDLVEFCRGDETTKWGSVRASMGHPDKFELKYIAVGNENEGNDYFERYQAFLDAFNAQAKINPGMYEGIELIYSAGASDAINGGNYIKSYKYAKDNIEDGNVTAFAGAVDQHYYNAPEWFLKNADYYDENNYKRNYEEMTDTIYGGAIPVFLGEYAARSNNLKAALSEAAYMTGLERNGDIVRMASYAPLFGNVTASHWSPDMIWLNNHKSIGSVNYYIQKLFMNNTGIKVVSSELLGAEVEQPVLKGRVGVGTWYTQAEFDNVKVVDNSTGKTICKDSFTVPLFFWNWENANGGNFKIKGGKLIHEGTDMKYSDIGDVAYFGTDDEMTDYTFTVEATKTDGEEGFLIPFAVQDKDNNYFWNLGGWQNTVSCLQKIESGVKTGQILKTLKDFTVETGKTYHLKVEVSGTKVKCYVNDELYVDYDTASYAEAESYQVVSSDENDLIIKLINVTEEARTFAVDISGNISGSAKAYQLSGESLDDINSIEDENIIEIKEIELGDLNGKFNYTVPKCSATVIRIKK